VAGATCGFLSFCGANIVARTDDHNLEQGMARPSKLSALSIDGLVKLRDDVSEALKQKAKALQKQLASLGSDYAEVGRIAIYGRRPNSLKGRKVAPKYRDPVSGETWAGRGVRPRWLVARLKGGKKLEDFAIKKTNKRGPKKVTRKK
jgi:DNA-binding protein H-NS